MGVFWKIGAGLGLVGSYQLKQYMGGTYNPYIADMNGKVVLVTGGNSGIGAETCKELVRLGSRVIITGRDMQKAKALLKEIREAQKEAGKESDRVEFHEVDFANLHEVKSFAEKMRKEYPKLDVLVNNAGASYDTLHRGAQQTELTMLTNHLAPMYLTHLLLPLLKSAENSRIINVASRAHARGENNFNPFEPSIQPRLQDYFFESLTEPQYKREITYNHSKLANIMFTKGLQNYIEKHNLNMKTVSLHPGVMRSPFMRGFSTFQRGMFNVMYPLMFVLMKDTHQGAQTTLATTLMPFEQLQAGGYYSDCELAVSSKPTHDPVLVKAVWDLSIDRIKQLTGEKSLFDSPSTSK